jgi:hypothetical protein
MLIIIRSIINEDLMGYYCTFKNVETIKSSLILLQIKPPRETNKALYMRIVAFLIVLVSITSCRKEEINIDIAEFTNRYLTCDSIKTIDGEVERVTVKGRGTGTDVLFDSAGIFTIFSVPAQHFYYMFGYSKIYYWGVNISMREGDYLQIVNKTDKKVILEHKEFRTDKRTISYYTAY